MLDRGDRSVLVLSYCACPTGRNPRCAARAQLRWC
jgi:hypothetical protein